MRRGPLFPSPQRCDGDADSQAGPEAGSPDSLGLGPGTEPQDIEPPLSLFGALLPRALLPQSELPWPSPTAAAAPNSGAGGSPGFTPGTLPLGSEPPLPLEATPLSKLLPPPLPLELEQGATSPSPLAASAADDCEATPAREQGMDRGWDSAGEEEAGGTQPFSDPTDVAPLPLAEPSAAADAHSGFAYESYTAADLVCIAAVAAALLLWGKFATHDRSFIPAKRRDTNQGWAPILSEQQLLLRVRPLIDAAARATALPPSERHVPQLQLLVLQLFAEIEEASKPVGGRCNCLRLTPIVQWAGADQSDVVAGLREYASACMVQPEPRRTSPWRIRLDGGVYNLPSVIARFIVVRHAEAWAAVERGGGLSMVCHKLQRECAYNSCLCLSPWHTDVFPFAEGSQTNMDRKGVDKKSKRGCEEKLHADIKKRMDEFQKHS